jgi:hypothetical protein
MGFRNLSPAPCARVGVLLEVLFNGGIRRRWMGREACLSCCWRIGWWLAVVVGTTCRRVVGWWAITEGKMEGVFTKDTLFDSVHVSRKESLIPIFKTAADPREHLAV